MMKLLKYELRKTRNIKWTLLAITLVVEVAFLVGLYSKKGDILGIGVTLLMALAVLSLLVVGLQSVVVLHQDTNTRQSYMLFMTPNSCWRILGAKVLECALSVLLMSAFFFALGALDITLLLEQEGILKEALDKLTSILNAFLRGSFDTLGIALATFYMVCCWLCTVMAALFADVCISSVLNGKRHTGLLWVVLFIALSLGVWWMQSFVKLANIKAALCALSGVCLACSAVMYAASAWLMERRLSV